MARKKKIEKDEKEISFPEFETKEETQITDTEQPANAESVEHPAKEKTKAERELETMLNDYETPLTETSESFTVGDEKTKRGRKKKVEDQPLIIPGELVVAIMNNISAGGMSLIDSWISKNPLPIEAHSLSEKQSAQLAPMADKALESLNKVIDPVSAFFYSYGAMVISNYVMIKAIQAKDPEAFKRHG